MSSANETLLEKAKTAVAYTEYNLPWQLLEDRQKLQELPKVAQAYHELMMKEVTKF